MGIEDDIKRIMERQDEMNTILNNIVNAIITDRKIDRQDKEKRIKDTMKESSCRGCHKQEPTNSMGYCMECADNLSVDGYDEKDSS
jgi:hypothetical protein